MGIHVPEQEDDIIAQNRLKFLFAYLDLLESVLMQVPQVLDSVRRELPTILQLAPAKYHFGTRILEPDNHCAFGRHVMIEI